MEKTSTSSDGQSPTQETLTPRFALEDDIPHLLPLVKDFVSYSPYAEVGYVEEDLIDALYLCLDKGCLIYNGTGFIAAVPAPLFINRSVKILQELGWWAPQGGGREMREMMEQWAKDTGSQIVRMTSLNVAGGERVAKNLADNGYTPIEIAYIKVL